MHRTGRYVPELHLDDLPLIEVTGEGRLEIPPDTAVITLGVTNRAETAAAAYAETARVLTEIVRALTEMDIPREQLQSSRIDLQPVYEKEKLIGYNASATLRVTLKELEAVGPVIDRAVAAGANTVQGLSFELRDPSPYEAEALSRAVDQAQETAALVARSLGVRLGRVWRAEAEPSPGPIAPPMARAYALEAAIPVLPGTLILSRRVEVAYLIQYE